MEIEFVIGEWTCKSSFLFVTTGRLVCPDALKAMLLDLCGVRTGGKAYWRLSLLWVSGHANLFLFSLLQVD